MCFFNNYIFQVLKKRKKKEISRDSRLIIYAVIGEDIIAVRVKGISNPTFSTLTLILVISRSIELKQSIPENTLTSLCFTWDKNTQKYKVYKNSMLQNTKPISNAQEIPKGGVFKLGGGDKIFKGLISHFNMWSYVLPMEKIALISHRCRAERGDVISWEDFKGLGTSDVVVSEDICPERGNILISKTSREITRCRFLCRPLKSLKCAAIVSKEK